jgi:hypothetical protein
LFDDSEIDGLLILVYHEDHQCRYMILTNQLRKYNCLDMHVVKTNSRLRFKENINNFYCYYFNCWLTRSDSEKHGKSPELFDDSEIDGLLILVYHEDHQCRYMILTN